MLAGIKKTYLYALIALVHILLCCVGFIDFRINPAGIVFCDYGDGLKNLFTLFTYVKEPIGSGGIFKYNTFAYPFGDYVYFTDNMPLFSIPFRFFCHYIYDLSAYTIPIFNLFIIANIIVCGVVVFAVFSRLFRERTSSLIMAFVLPWANMQILRIVRGHYSLSFTSLVILAFYLLLVFHENHGNRKKQVFIGLGMCLLSFASFLAHGYLFAIVTLFITFALLFYGIITRKEQEGKFNLVFAAVYPFLALGFSLGIAAATDKYMLLRQENAMGYDWMEQKVRFCALFTHYQFNKISFPFSPLSHINDPEKAAYLGNIGIYTLLAILLGIFISKKARSIIASSQRHYFKDPLMAAIFFSGLLLLSISFGEIYYTHEKYEDGLRLINIFNPFFYLHLFTKKIEQFRSLERFIYPFFFSFYIWITYTLIKVHEQSAKPIRTAIIVLVIFLGGAEVKDNIERMQKGTDLKNPFSTQAIGELKAPIINSTKYQAILPLPYYCSGSENYDYTIDVDDHWFLYTQQLAIKTQLPLMSYVLSRVPPEHNIQLLNAIANDSMSNSFLQLFTDNKPVLVAVNKKMIADNDYAGIPSNPIGAALYKKTCQFVARHNLAPIDSMGDVVFYEWYLTKPKMALNSYTPSI